MRRRNKGNYAFIDSQNLNVSVQNYGWKMNWRKFREFLAERFNVTQAFMFIGYVPENEDLYEKMHEAGYAVVLKPTFDMTRPREENEGNGNGNGDHDKKVKGNVDADLVLWAMKELGNYDKAVIVSGDGDFFSLVEYLQQQGKLAKILTPTGQYSGLYHQFNDYIERVDEHRRELAYYDKKPGYKKQKSNAS
ncbi:MAG TPA: NYN domain-containing protein [Candidatus Saccharimonadales bacterium]|nr:NYN domain-containing protein [Candidatus Saccharimonadales bacterium]